MIFEPRFDYAREIPSFSLRKSRVVAKGTDEVLALLATKDIHFNTREQRAEAEWKLSEGETVWLHLHYGGNYATEFDPASAEASLKNTRIYWENWIEKSETGVTVDLGRYQEMVNRSALALKLLYYNPTGTIAAAATTSLPERIGGVRNWDYRYTWVRDTSFTVQALFNLGHLSETEGYLRWIEKLLSRHGAEKLQIMYGLRGEEDLPEHELMHLDGYKGSKPVRIGNGAAKQKQLDIYGELMDAAVKLSDYVGKISKDMWPFLQAICEYVTDHWRDRDSGIWEVRGGPDHFVYSKVMCWVALDRGLIIARRYGFPADLQKWKKVREEIKKEVLQKGFHEKKQAFVQHYETDALDSSNLLIPIFGFLPHNDPRVVSTVEAIMKELSNDGLLYRYQTEDGIEGGEGVFLLCSFWLIDILISMGRVTEAEAYLHRMESIANHVGLFSEQYDIDRRENLGNFPQAFTHIGYINAVLALCRAKEKMAGDQSSKKKAKPGLFPGSAIILNDGNPDKALSSKDIVAKLKNTMNILRGAFFDTKRGRVAYEQMHNSQAYSEYVRLSYNLKGMDLSELKSRQEQLAFWINLYNVLVIHGVIELGIRDSVKEARNFFGRVRYQIGDFVFSPDDIEHGILRANSRPPHAVFRPFGKKDGRIHFIISPMDSRIHFALVCASSSCPPIGIYTAENIGRELTIAAETFLNAGGIVIDRQTMTVSLSKIFDWYRRDFGKNIEERLKFLSSYLYNPEDRQFMQDHGERIKIEYMDYDWRLNRY